MKDVMIYTRSTNVRNLVYFLVSLLPLPLDPMSVEVLTNAVQHFAAKPEVGPLLRVEI